MDKPDNKIIIGKPGSGKSKKALNLVKECRRVLIFDTLGHDYSDGVVFYDLAGLKAFWRSVYAKSFRIIYRPLNDIEEFDEVCKLVWACRDMTFLAEELDTFCPNGKSIPSFIRILKRGRHRDIHFIGITQRPMGINRNVTAMANEVFVFNTDEPGDLDYFKDRLSAEAVEKIIALEPYQWIRFENRGKPIEVGKDEIL